MLSCTWTSLVSSREASQNRLTSDVRPMVLSSALGQVKYDAMQCSNEHNPDNQSWSGQVVRHQCVRLQIGRDLLSNLPAGQSGKKCACRSLEGSPC